MNTTGSKYKRCLFAMLILLWGTAWQLTCQGQVFNQRRDFLATYLFGGVDESTFKKQLEFQIDMRVERVSKVVSLQPAQIEKIKLAARGDLSRFYRELEAVKAEVSELDASNGNDVQRGWQAIQPLSQRLSKGIIDENSLLERVLSTVLGPEQERIYREYVRERQLARYQAIVRMTVSDMEKVLPLTAHQRDEMIKILEQKNFPRVVDSSMEAYVGYAMLARLSDQETDQLLDVPQRKVFRELTQQHAQWLNSFTW